MDVSIGSSDQSARDKRINARSKHQAAKDARARRRLDRKVEKRDATTDRRLRRRISRRIGEDLVTERRKYLYGETTGEEYLIDAVVRYGRRRCVADLESVEEMLDEAFAEHTGFTKQVTFLTDPETGKWCRGIRIRYTLLER